MNKAKHYIDELNTIDEHVKIEAKQCSDKIDKSVLETLNALYESKDEMYGKNELNSGQKVESSEPKVVTLDGKVVTNSEKVITLDIFGNSIIQALNSLGKRGKKVDLEDIIIEMCQVMPLSIDEIAVLTKRTINYIRVKILPGLLREKRIRFTIPEMKNHPNQKYIASK